MKSQCAKALAKLRSDGALSSDVLEGDPMHTLNYLAHSTDSVRGRTDKHLAEVYAQIRSSRPRRASGQRPARPWWSLLWS